MPRPPDALDCEECLDEDGRPTGAITSEIDEGDPGYAEYLAALSTAQQAYDTACSAAVEAADDEDAAERVPVPAILDEDTPQVTRICEECEGRGWVLPLTAEEEAAQAAENAQRRQDAQAEHVRLAHPNGERVLFLYGRTCMPSWCPVVRGEWGPYVERISVAGLRQVLGGVGVPCAVAVTTSGEELRVDVGAGDGWPERVAAAHEVLTAAGYTSSAGPEAWTLYVWIPHRLRGG